MQTNGAAAAGKPSTATRSQPIRCGADRMQPSIAPMATTQTTTQASTSVANTAAVDFGAGQASQPGANPMKLSQATSTAAALSATSGALTPHNSSARPRSICGG